VVTLSVAHLAFYGVFGPQARFNQSAACHSAKTMATELRLGIKADVAQCFVNSSFRNWLPPGMITRKNQLEVSGHFADLLEQQHHLCRQGNKVGIPCHFCASSGELHPLNRLSGIRYLPDRSLQVELGPSGESQLTRPD